MVYRSCCVFGETVSYYEMDFKTGDGAYYNDGALELYTDGQIVLSEKTNQEVRDYFCVEEIIEAISIELAKPVQQSGVGYHHFVTKSTFVSYANETEGRIGNNDYFKFFASFNVHKSQPIYRSYSFGFSGSGLIRKLYYNNSGMSAEYLKQRYESFKVTGEW